MIGLQPLQRSLAGGNGAATRCVARQHLGDEIKVVVLAARDRIRDHEFGVAIHFSGIDVGHAEFDATAAPEPQARKPKTERKVVRLPKSPKPQPAGAARNSSRPMTRKSLPALLIFASMVALIVTYRFLTH